VSEGRAAHGEPRRAAPTEPALRARPIDALRGLALIGIAIVNVPWLGFRESLPSMLWNDATRAAMPVWDLAAAGLVEALFEGRFYPIFSALFGLGAGIVIDRGLAPYTRRIAVLAVLGVLHATFGWYGDVLLNYAAAGVVLVFLSREPRVLFLLAGILFVVTQVVSFRLDTWFGPPSPEHAAEQAAYLDASVRAYRDGSFLSITAHRLDELRGYFTASYNVSYRLNVLAMATLGLAIERTGVHRRLEELRRPLGRLALGLTLAGIALSASLLVAPWLYLVAGDVLAAGYATSFLWLALSPRVDRRLDPLVAVGRTALSCYLLQTVCFTLFFYGYGLAMYGALGAAEGLLLAISVYLLGALLATAWLRRFEHGPMEWLWRMATYLRRLPLRRSRVASAATP
jgi:uncharacterized protein